MINYELIKLYCELVELQQLLNSEILPLAAQVGLSSEDPDLIKAAEKFANELDRHLKEYQVQLSKSSVKTFKKNF